MTIAAHQSEGRERLIGAYCSRFLFSLLFGAGLRPATCDLRPATCDLRHATSDQRPATCDPFSSVHQFSSFVQFNNPDPDPDPDSDPDSDSDTDADSDSDSDPDPDPDPDPDSGVPHRAARGLRWDDVVFVFLFSYCMKGEGEGLKFSLKGGKGSERGRRGASL